jgi:hypothetical protein
VLEEKANQILLPYAKDVMESWTFWLNGLKATVSVKRVRAYVG